MNAKLKADSLHNNPSNLVEEYYRLKPDGHFFDKDTMKYFNSKLVRSPIKVHGERVFFITSEKMDRASRRHYKVRSMDLNTGNVVSLSEELRNRPIAEKILRSKSCE